MRTAYDFSEAKPNPYAKQLAKRITIRLDPSVLAHFRGLEEELGIPYRTLINLCLKECTSAGKRAKRGSREKFEAALARLPNAEPDDHDRL